MALFSSLLVRPKDHIAVFDGVRAIANILIVVMHVWLIATYMRDRNTAKEWAKDPFATLYLLGVGSLDIFWVLAGFFVSLNVQKAITLRRSLISCISNLAITRLARLWPLLLLMISLSIIFGDSDSLYLPSLFFYANYVAPRLCSESALYSVYNLSKLESLCRLSNVHHPTCDCLSSLKVAHCKLRGLRHHCDSWGPIASLLVFA